MTTIAIKKILSLTLSILLVLQPIVVPAVVYAEDEMPPATPEAQEATPPPAPQTQTQTEPTPASSATMTTGDSAAAGTQSVTANTTDTTIPGSISVGSCSVEVQTGCPVNIDNDVTVQGTVTADATSGGNTTLDEPGDATQKTGTASATAINSTDLNTTVISASASAGPTGASGPGGSIDIANSVTLETEASASATSGQNTEKNISGDATIQTGASVASAYSLNVINTTMLGANVRFLVINIDGKRAGDIDLNALWKEIQDEQEGRKTVLLDGSGSVVDITNSSSTFTRVAATAISGENSVANAGGDGTVVTGDAFASAGLINLQNTTIIESRILVVVINIYGDYIGDLVLPSSERFIEEAKLSTTSGSLGKTTLANAAAIGGSTTSAVADSGTNSIIGSSQNQTIQTGDAYAAANELIFANTQYYIDYFYHILYNNFGSHLGGITGMENPQDSMTATPFSSLQYSIVDSQSSGETSAQEGSNLTITNTADGSYTVSALARSGGNSLLDVGGDTVIQTGTSVAIANVLSFFNTTIFGNSIFVPVINLFGRWVGNLVFARPDLFVSITPSRNPVNPGEELEYVVSYVNGGKEEARGAVVSLELPADMTFVSSTLPDGPTISGSTYQFYVGTVPVGVSNAFTVHVRLAATIAFDLTKPPTLLGAIRNALIPKVMAADNLKLETVHVTITTSDTESDMTNNKAQADTHVTLSPTLTSSSGSASSYDVRMGVSNSNNANGAVYPGDMVHFTVQLTNDGASLAKDTVLTQTLETGSGQVIGAMTFSLGEILSKKAKTVSYDLTIPAEAPAGIYVTKSSAAAYDESGKKIETGGGASSFSVILRQLGIVENVQAAEPQVKGAETSVPSSPPCTTKRDYLAYGFIGILTILWFVEFIRRRRLEKELQKIP